MRSRRNKANRHQAFPSLANDGVWTGEQEGKPDKQPWRQALESIGGWKITRASHNQLGTFDQTEPRHQLLRDNRQACEPRRAAGTVGTTGQWPAGTDLVNMAHRAKSRWCPSLKCSMKAAKWTISTAKSLFPSCQLSTVALSQARHPFYADCLVGGEWCNGVECMNPLLNILDFLTHIHCCCNETYANTHTNMRLTHLSL